MEEGYEIPVVGNGYVRYVEHLGSDMSILKAARISYKGASKGEKKDKGLIMYLYKNRHTSPFEMVNITYNIKMPIFCMRQLVRHRTFRLNEVSARYTEMDEDFFVPDEYRVQDKKNKQSSVDSTELDHEEVQKIIQYNSDKAYRAYQDLLEKGVAREMARMVLPVNINTEIFVNVDLNNLFKFLALRCDGHAQSEMQEIAQAMKTIAEELYPWSFEAYNRTKITVEIIED